MKKSIFKSILIFTLLFFVAGCKNDKKAELIKQDCESLKTFLTEADIGVSKAVDEGFDIDGFIKEIQDKNLRHINLRKGKTIDDDFFAKSIYKALRKSSLPKNGHFSISSKENIYVSWKHNYYFYSELYFEKINENYVLADNYSKKLKKGMIYTGDVKNLYKTVKNGKILYQYAVMSPYLIKNSKIQLNNKKHKIKVNFCIGNTNYTKNFDYDLINKKTLYIQSNTCSIHTEQEDKLYFEGLKELESLYDGVENIILDLRNNIGGHTKYITSILNYLMFKDSDLDNNFNKIEKYLQFENCSLNTKTTINKYILKNENLSYVQNLKNNLDKKYLYEQSEPNVPNIPSPWFKGKIYIITSAYTASASEYAILTTKYLFGDSVVIIGQNSFGSLEYTDMFDYSLPNSKIFLHLSRSNFSQSNLMKNNPYWKGENNGIYPNFWFTFDQRFAKKESIAELINEISSAI